MKLTKFKTWGTIIACAILLGIGDEASAALHRLDRVLGHSMDSWRIYARVGAVTTVVVDGDGDTDLDLYVYDENGNLIDSDTDFSDYCLATWTPLWSGYFTIRIVNRGAISNVYRLRVEP